MTQEQKDTTVNLMSKLLLNPEFADVTFIIEGDQLPAHRNILAASSEYFRGLLYGSFAESKTSEIKLNVKLEPFKAILMLIYTGNADLKKFNDDLLIDVLRLAHEYGYQHFVLKIAKAIEERLKFPTNIIEYFNAAILYDLKSIQLKARGLIEKRPKGLISNNSFEKLSKNALKEIISWDKFSLPELEIFQAVLVWSAHHTTEDLMEVISEVRFALMQICDLQNIVAPTKILSAAKIEEHIENIKTLPWLPHRDGLVHRNKLSCHTLSLSIGNGYIWQHTNEQFATRTGALFKVSFSQMFNYIEIHFNDEHTKYHPYDYFIEVSDNLREWQRIIDYSGYHCFSKQKLYFPLCSVLYIFISPSRVSWFSEKFELKQLLINYNFRFAPKLINGFLLQTDWRRFAHEFSQLTSSSLSIIFPQPIYINCCYVVFDDRNCSFDSIKVSLDGCNYKQLETKLDHRGEMLLFNMELVSYVCLKLKQIPKYDSITKVYCFYHLADINLAVCTPNDQESICQQKNLF